MRREVIKKHTQKEREKEPPDTRACPACARSRPPALAEPDDDDDDEDAIGEVSIARGPAQKPLPFTLTPNPTPRVRRTRPKRKRRSRSPRAPRRVSVPTPSGDMPLPPTAILDEIKPSMGMDKARLFEKAKTLQAKCAEFGVMGTWSRSTPGPWSRPTSSSPTRG